MHTRKDVSEKDSTTPSFVTDSWTPDGLPKSGFASFLVDDKNLPGPALYAVYGDSIWNLHPLEKTPAVKVADAAVSGSCADSGTLFYVKRDTRRFESWTAGEVAAVRVAGHSMSTLLPSQGNEGASVHTGLRYNALQVLKSWSRNNPEPVLVQSDNQPAHV